MADSVTDSGLAQILERLDQIDGRFDQIEAHIEEVEISLSNQIKSLDNRIDGLDKRMFRLESLVTSLTEAHGSFATAALRSLDHVRERVDQLQGRVLA